MIDIDLQPAFAPLRAAGLLAKTAATLQAISHGRFVLGVTASWQKDEYDALGVPYESRVTKDGLSRPLSTGQPLLDLFG